MRVQGADWMPVLPKLLRLELSLWHHVNSHGTKVKLSNDLLCQFQRRLQCVHVFTTGLEQSSRSP